MNIENKDYRLTDFIGISMSVAPVATMLRIIDKVIYALVPSMQVLATASFVDTAMQIFNGRLDKSNIFAPLIWMAILASYYFMSDILFGLVRSVTSIRLNQIFRPAVTEKRATLEYHHIENNETWDLISRVGNNPDEKIDDGFDAILHIGIAVIQTASVFIVLATQVWWAAFVIIAFSVPLFRVAIKCGKQNYDAYKESQKHIRRAKYLQSVLTERDNVEERSLFGYSDKINSRWYEKFLAAFKIEMKVRTKSSVRMRVGSLITVLISVLIAGVLIFPLTSGSISIGMFMGLVNATFGLVRTMSWELTWIAGDLAAAREYLKDLTAFSKLSVTKGATDEPAETMPIPGCIEFKNVSFAYPGTEKLILQNLNMKLLAGRHYAFVGTNGAGKTTITKLMTGLYDNYAGDILIDGKNLRSFTQSELKALFSVVYQDFAKYQIPFINSVSVSNPKAAHEEVNNAVRLVGLDEVVGRLPQGIYTPLGKISVGSVDLSGGEWQRTAIIRSILSRAPVHILDEPTAALDPVAESAVYEMYGEISKGKSTVFITHRLGAAKLADEIFVIADGSVGEKGTHDELMNRAGLYAEMFESQRGWYIDG